MFYDPSKPPGERLAPELREEIAEVAPSTVTNGSITDEKLAEGSVIEGKYAIQSIPPEAFQDNSIPTSAYEPGSVDTDALADNAVTPVKCATGVPTCVDSTGSYIENTFWFGTATQYTAIVTKDPNFTYFTSA